MTDTPHFTAMDAYRAVYVAQGGRINFEITEHINFITLADHINAAIADAVKVEREACAEAAEGGKSHFLKMRDGTVIETVFDREFRQTQFDKAKGCGHVATAIRARGAK